MSGLAATRLAKSVHDASWSTLVRLFQEKALRYHPAVVNVSGWLPRAGCVRCVGSTQGRNPWRLGPGPPPRVASPTIGI